MQSGLIHASRTLEGTSGRRIDTGGLFYFTY